MALQTFPAGSSGGPDGVTPQHLKDLLNDKTNDKLASNLRDMVNLQLAGAFPNEVNEILNGGRLTALQKKDGGIRPIAVGYTWRRLAAKCANHHVIERASKLLAPLQLGVGIPGGAEAAVHATRRFIDGMPKDSVIVKLDFSNAFNTLRRDTMLEAVAKDLPEIYAFAHANYSDATQLKFSEHVVLSEEGPQQGDPLGSLMFCLALQRLLRELTASLQVGYLDDLTLGGNAQTVAADVDHIMANSERYGLKLNISKCELIAEDPSKFSHIKSFKNFRLVQVEDMTLLGAPVMGNRAMETSLKEKTLLLQNAIGRLRDLNSHDALTILRNSLGIPKMQYVLRTSNCGGRPELIEFDNILKSGLIDLLNVELSDSQWTQASLPIRSGGLGFRSAATLATSAFLASAVSTLEIQESILIHSTHAPIDQNVTRAIAFWQSLTTESPPLLACQHKQRSWDDILVRDAYKTLLASAKTDMDKARLLAAQQPHAGDWLLAPPITSVGLRMSDEEIRISAGLRLGARLCHPHRCICGANVDERGTHGLSCRKSAGRQLRHSTLNDIICRSIRRAGVQSLKEPLGLSRDDGKRPDGVTLTPWSRGRCLAWDVTVPDTFAASHLAMTSTTPSAAADKAAANKTAKYQQLTQTHILTPVAIETTGAYNIQASQFLQEIGRRTTVETGDVKETVYLFQRISVAIQRGNALSIRGTHFSAMD